MKKWKYTRRIENTVREVKIKHQAIYVVDLWLDLHLPQSHWVNGGALWEEKSVPGMDLIFAWGGPDFCLKVVWEWYALLGSCLRVVYTARKLSGRDLYLTECFWEWSILLESCLGVIYSDWQFWDWYVYITLGVAKSGHLMQKSRYLT